MDRANRPKSPPDASNLGPAGRDAGDAVGGYIAQCPPETQEILRTLRALIRDIAPDASEKISYGMPTFELNGKYVVDEADEEVLVLTVLNSSRQLEPSREREAHGFEFCTSGSVLNVRLVRTPRTTPAMQTKLTLRLEASLIRRAKAYAKARGKSVSQVVADFFSALEPTQQPDAPVVRELPPITESLYGRLANTGIDDDEYRRHLQEKHH